MHGPNVETVTMPEADYFTFRRSLSAPPAAQPDQLAMAMERFATEYVAYYEMDDGEGHYHVPTKGERALILDCVMGILAEPEFIAAAAPPAAKQEDAQPVARLTGEQVAELAQRYLSETECILLLRLQAPDEIRPSTNLWAFVDALSDLLAPPAGERDAVDVDLLRAEHTEMRDMLADARIELQMIREALGVSYEPHQTLLERTMDAARREGLR